MEPVIQARSASECVSLPRSADAAGLCPESIMSYLFVAAGVNESVALLILTRWRVGLVLQAGSCVHF
jgi:hypothetical protein